MNFWKVIGKYMADSGLRDTQAESGVHGENTADNILHGSLWKRVVPASQLTYEAHLQILWTAFVEWLGDRQQKHAASVTKLAGQLEQDHNAFILQGHSIFYVLSRE